MNGRTWRESMSSKSLRLAAAGAVALWALIGTPQSGVASGAAGNWQARFNVTCVNGPQNVALCKAFFGPLKAIGHSGVALIAGSLSLKGAQANAGPPTPARAGHYAISWAATAVGVKRVPAGVSGGLVVTHGG
jgi:hypothetical protein